MLKVRKNEGPPLIELCALSNCMTMLSGRWAANVIWHLRSKPRRFNELRTDIPPISAKILSARLRELEAKGVLTRHVLQTSPPSVEYQLTDLGDKLVPALDAIAAVGHELKGRQKHIYLES